MRVPYPLRHALATIAVMILMLVGCDQQQPLAQKPSPAPAFKPGETPPAEPDKGPAGNGGGNVPLPPATGPATDGVQNSPTAPAALPPPPTSSPTEAPIVIPPTKEPPAKEHGAVLPRPSASSSDDPTTQSPSIVAPASSAQRDQLISNAIYRAIASQPGLSPDGSLITINTIEGEVTLNGSVTSDGERDQIAALAGQVAGVRSINNRLDLNGP